MSPDTRNRAIRILAIAASTPGLTCREIAEQLELGEAWLPALRAVAASIGGGRTARETRAEAEARLRCGEMR